MRNFFRENMALALGILLPIVVMLAFGLATFVPRLFVEPPKYDLLLSSGEWSYNNGMKFEVENGKLVAKFTYTKNNYYNQAKLYLYSVKTQDLTEIKIKTPQVTPTTKPFTQVIEIPSVKNALISAAIKSPDGYVFRNNYDRSNLVTEIFFNSRANMPSISKDGYTLPLSSDLSNYDYYGFKFVGWIIKW